MTIASENGQIFTEFVDAESFYIVETSVGERGLSRLVEQKLKGLAKALYKKQQRVY